MSGRPSNARQHQHDHNDALIQACVAGDLPKVKAALNAGANVSAVVVSHKYCLTLLSLVTLSLLYRLSIFYYLVTLSLNSKSFIYYLFIIYLLIINFYSICI